jgi:hypothetical protein
VSGLRTPLRTPSHAAVTELRVRFVPSSELLNVGFDAAEQVCGCLCESRVPWRLCRTTPWSDACDGACVQHLANVVAGVSPDGNEFGFADFQVSSADDALQYLSANRGRDLTPWYSTFRHEVHRTLRCMEHEMFDHPVALVVVAATSDDEPLSCLMELSSSHHLPPPFHNVRVLMLSLRCATCGGDGGECADVWLACGRGVTLCRATTTPTSRRSSCCCTITAAALRAHPRPCLQTSRVTSRACCASCCASTPSLLECRRRRRTTAIYGRARCPRRCSPRTGVLEALCSHAHLVCSVCAMLSAARSWVLWCVTRARVVWQWHGRDRAVVTVGCCGRHQPTAWWTAHAR